MTTTTDERPRTKVLGEDIKPGMVVKRGDRAPRNCGLAYDRRYLVVAIDTTTYAGEDKQFRTAFLCPLEGAPTQKVTFVAPWILEPHDDYMTEARGPSAARWVERFRDMQQELVDAILDDEGTVRRGESLTGNGYVTRRSLYQGTIRAEDVPKVTTTRPRFTFAGIEFAAVAWKGSHVWSEGAMFTVPRPALERILASGKVRCVVAHHYDDMGSTPSGSACPASGILDDVRSISRAGGTLKVLKDGRREIAVRIHGNLSYTVTEAS